MYFLILLMSPRHLFGYVWNISHVTKLEASRIHYGTHITAQNQWYGELIRVSSLPIWQISSIHKKDNIQTKCHHDDNNVCLYNLSSYIKYTSEYAIHHLSLSTFSHSQSFLTPSTVSTKSFTVPICRMKTLHDSLSKGHVIQYHSVI